MAKVNIFTELSLEYYDQLLCDASVVMWRTTHQPFTFAFYFNELYQLNLQRQEDIELTIKDKTVAFPVYGGREDINQMAFFLIENDPSTMSGDAQFSYFDKIMLFIGPDAAVRAGQIVDDLERPRPECDNCFVSQREDRRIGFVEKGIVETALFDFSDPDFPTTTYFSLAAPGTTLRKKQKSYLDGQRKFVVNLLVALDDRMPNFEDDVCNFELTRKTVEPR